MKRKYKNECTRALYATERKDAVLDFCNNRELSIIGKLMKHLNKNNGCINSDLHLQ